MMALVRNCGKIPKILVVRTFLRQGLSGKKTQFFCVSLGVSRIEWFSLGKNSVLLVPNPSFLSFFKMNKQYFDRVPCFFLEVPRYGLDNLNVLLRKFILLFSDSPSR